jgi:wobble nucleotide-excising tRNase
VFDDPITSLDTARRTATRHIIDQLAKECGQVWVLSHDAYFLRDCVRSHRQATLLHLQYSDGGATLAPWDAEEACRSEYFRRLDLLRRFVAGGSGAPDADTARQKIRPVLEGYLRVRYSKVWNRNDWLGDFIGKARAGQVALPEEQIEQLQTWSDFANPSMHDDPSDAAPPPTPDNVRAVAREVLESVHG